MRRGANLIQSVGSSGSSSSSGPAAAADDPKLGPLADNGGPTLTMALLRNSPAQNGGGFAVQTPFLDQRGYPRLVNYLDIGAYESEDGYYDATGLRLQTLVPEALILGGPMRFEVSSDPDFWALASTHAGIGTVGSTNGTAAQAKFSYPADVARDTLGNLFIADAGNNLIRMISPDGVVSTIAGTGGFGFLNGPGPQAKFASPAGIAVGPGNHLYVGDTLNHRIRKLTRPVAVGEPWTVSTVAGSGTAGFLDGTSTATRFDHPHGVAVALDGTVYVADTSNHRIRKVTTTGIVSTYAGTGAAAFSDGHRSLAQFSSPYGVAVDAQGVVFVGDYGNHRIRGIGLDNQATTLAGSTVGLTDGLGTVAQFKHPAGLSMDNDGNLLVADQGNHAVRKVTRPIAPTDPWRVTTLGGTGTAGLAEGRVTYTGAKFNTPTGVCADLKGDVIVADQLNHRLRRIAFPIRVEGIPTSLSGLGQQLDGIVDAASLGIVLGTRYYFRWVAADGSAQMIGQSFTYNGSPFVVWQNEKFGADAGNPLIAGPLANPAGDGANNQSKYALGLDPHTQAGPLLPKSHAQGNLVTLSYTKSVSATDVDCIVQWSTDLIEWHETGVTHNVVSSNATTQQWESTVSTVGVRKMFLRLAITLHQP